MGQSVRNQEVIEEDCSLKPDFHSNAIACVGKQPIMVATASTEHSYWLALAFVAWKTQALAFLAVFVYATHATQAIAFEWKPGLRVENYWCDNRELRIWLVRRWNQMLMHSDLTLLRERSCYDVCQIRLPSLSAIHSSPEIKERYHAPIRYIADSLTAPTRNDWLRIYIGSSSVARILSFFAGIHRNKKDNSDFMTAVRLGLDPVMIQWYFHNGSVAARTHQSSSCLMSTSPLYLLTLYLLILLHCNACNSFAEGWLGGSVVERRSLTGKLSLVCTGPAADG